MRTDRYRFTAWVEIDQTRRNGIQSNSTIIPSIRRKTPTSPAGRIRRGTRNLKADWRLGWKGALPNSSNLKTAD